MIVIVAYVVNIVGLPLFSDTSYKSGSACCHQCMNEIAAFFVNYPLCFFTKIRNQIDKYVITKNYHQLMPLSLATYGKSGKNTCEGKYNCEGEYWIGEGEYWIGEEGRCSLDMSGHILTHNAERRIRLAVIKRDNKFT
ncbi:conserved hypothetical protein, partial [Trichinella spiralis]|uniref:hypothetical protein n=1 Tax=Trichinella spiralis TaxID=6334 RepID=UPI0001EFBDC2